MWLWNSHFVGKNIQLSALRGDLLFILGVEASQPYIYTGINFVTGVIVRESRYLAGNIAIVLLKVYSAPSSSKHGES